MPNMHNVTKLSSPRASSDTGLAYVVNIYKNGKFKFAYRYEGWTGAAVHNEVKFLRQRFSSHDGYSIEW